VQAANHPRFTFADFAASPESIVGFGVAVLLIIGVAVLAFVLPGWVLRKLDEKIEKYRRGEEGEEKVVEKARQALDGQWTLFRNVLWPGRKGGDADIVLVGPPGVWAIEVKALRGKYRNVGESWHYRAGAQWKNMTRNPSVQARRVALGLKDFLKADGIKTYVSEAVAWADEEGQLSVQDPTVPVWTLNRLEDELGNLGNGHPLGQAEKERIVEKLTRLCQAPRKGPW
jgi:hypothetical protein